MKREMLLAAALALAAPAAAEPSIDGPVLLVATTKHDDGMYSRTVLIAASWQGGHVGLVLNRRTEARMEHLFPDFAPARRIVDTLYYGGHRWPSMVFALKRSAERPSDGAVEMVPGTWLIPEAATIDAVIETTPNEARYFIGAVGWPAGRLRIEIDAGMWAVRPADPARLFQPDTSTLHDELAPAGTPPAGARST